MENEFNIYHTETQEDYDDLMIKLNKEGYTWANGDKLTSKNYWTEHTDETVIYVDSWEEGEMTRGYFSEAKSLHPTTPIIKHKAKGVEQMEKVVVPQFVADWYEKSKTSNLHALLGKFSHEFMSGDQNISEWAKCCEGRNLFRYENAQEIIAKMHLYGYEVEEEKKYYWRKKKEYCLGFETEDEVFIRYYYKKNKMYLGDRPVYLFLVPSYEPYKTKFTEKEVRELVSEEDFNKLEKVEIVDDEC